MTHGRGFIARKVRAVAGAGATLALAFSCTVNAGAQDGKAPPGALALPKVADQAVPAAPAAPMTPGVVPADAVPPDAVVVEEDGVSAGGDGPACDGTGTPDWTKIPPLSPLPRTGNFTIFPTGPGYYSLQDVVTGNCRDKAPKTPWPPVSPDFFPFYDADFRYLDDPKNTQHDWLDPLKRIHLGDNWLFSTGGEVRNQWKNEYDSRLTGVNNQYDLVRTRVYGDLWFKDRFRIYVEGIDAQSSPQSLPPQPIDRNKGDFLDLFFDLKVADIQDHGLYIRGGRQELCYGSQRLISPLDWANTRRTFEGVKGFWHSEKFDVDAFFVKPVIIDQNRFDYADATRPFAGLWATYRPKKGQAIDLYYLYLDHHSAQGAVPAIPGTRSGQNVNTLGSRYVGDRDGSLLWDFEGMYQFGTTIGNQSIAAGAATAGLGYRFKDACMTPTLWLYNDWASGDSSGGKGGTFNQLFPFGHFYFGFLDEVGRQNIEDVNLHLNFFPTKWMFTSFQGHFMYLDSGKDALYNAGGVPIRKDPTGSSGLHVGNEIDWVTNFHLTTHQDVLIGFSQLFAGEFIRNTGSPKSPQLFYIQYSYKW